MASAPDYAAVALGYADAVLRGRIVACKLVKAACYRFKRDLREKKRWVFSPAAVAHVCGFVELLPHVEGTWDSARIRLEPWQIFLLANVFGFRLPDGTRRFRNVYIEVARKNAKSTLSSVIALYCLVMEGELGPKVLTAATTGDQARHVFDPAKLMVRRTPDLRDAAELTVYKDAIVCDMNGGSIRPINAEAGKQDGKNPHLVVIDELHAHKDRGLYDVLASAFGSRRNPLMWMITTAGYNTQGVCYEQRKISEDVLSGTLEANDYFALIYTLDEGDDPFDEAVWIKANPNLGVSVLLPQFRGYAAIAKHSVPSQGEFKTKRLNIWLNAVSSWLDVAKWDRCADPALRREQFAGRDCWIGCDLSDKNDITAVCLQFLDDEWHPVLLFRFYLPADVVGERAHTTGAHYLDWATSGDLTLTEGDWISREKILEDLRADIAMFNVRSILFDQFSGAQMLAEALKDEVEHVGFYAKTAKNFTAPATEFESRILRGRLRHDGNKVMRWMVGNAAVERRVDKSLLPKKSSRDSTRKIDGVDAALLASAGAMTVAVPTNGPVAGFYMF